MKKGKGYITISMLIFGSIGLFVRNIQLTSSEIAVARGFIGSIFILVVLVLTRQKFSWKAIRPNLVLLIASGTAIGINWILLFEAYRYTTISNATLSYYFAPVFVMFLSPFLLKEKLRAGKLLGIIGAVIGMFLIVGVESVPGNNHLLGITYGLLAAVFYASDILMNKFIKNLSGLETTIIQLTAASFVLLPYVLVTQKTAISLDMKSLVLLLIVGVIHTGIAYILYFSAIKRLSGQTIAVLCYIDPISAILMSNIFLGEQLSALQITGGILILGAAFFHEFDYKKTFKRGVLWWKSEKY
ncbi:MAG: protein of unknown function transrane [Herbinix sp.]|jgi:RarD protein|nr:protein of unknown function transrane [Herbinix sp.]